MDITLALIGIAWLAIVAMLVWCFVDGMLRFWDSAPLPFLGMLERRGLTLARAEAAMGMDALAHALRRCTHCRLRPQCSGAAVEAACPNLELLHKSKAL